jgi:hypothetical protein
MRTGAQLRIVRDDEPVVAETKPAPMRRAGASGDLLLLAGLFLLNLIPVLGELAHPGRWSPAIVGFSVGALLLTGRELWSQLRALRAAKTGAERTR